MAVVIKSSPVPVRQKAKQIYEEYRFLDAAISFYPAKDLLFYQADIRSKELVSQRMQVIQAVLKGEPITVVASFDAFMDALLPKRNDKEQGDQDMLRRDFESG